ncbi:MAG: FadR/GntR family transcriptional regulator [Rhodospirillales bacterium]
MPNAADSPPAKTPRAKPRFRSLGSKSGLVYRVVEAIEKEILEGRLPLGASLPPERDFAERLGVSRTVVREAVRILVTRGLLQTRHGVGTTVRAVTPEQVTTPLTLFMRTCGSAVTIEHLHQVRLMVEVGNAVLAAEQATEEDIQDLRNLCAAMEAAADDPQQFAAKDAEFHRRLAEATHNPLAVLLLDSVRGLISEVRTLVAQRPGLFERVMPGHIRVLECVAAHDAEGAGTAMREHLAVALSIQKELTQGQE